jgi:hypothetical protein
MKIKMVCFAVVACLTSAGTSRAEEPAVPGPTRLDLDLVDGSRVVGTAALASIAVRTVYARMEIPLAQIRTVKIGEDRATVALGLQNGDRITGSIAVERIDLATSFGKVAIRIEHIRRFSVIPGRQQPETGGVSGFSGRCRRNTLPWPI